MENPFVYGKVARGECFRTEIEEPMDAYPRLSHEDVQAALAYAAKAVAYNDRCFPTGLLFSPHNTLLDVDLTRLIGHYLK